MIEVQCGRERVDTLPIPAPNHIRVYLKSQTKYTVMRVVGSTNVRRVLIHNKEARMKNEEVEVGIEYLI